MKEQKRLSNFLKKCAGVKVLVIGDVMLDRYWWGTASRLSPEAPVPVVALKEISNLAGGAANVAANIAGLGAEPFLFGIVGVDEASRTLSETLQREKVSPKFLISFEDRPTTTKTRIIVDKQHVARVDEEVIHLLDESQEKTLLARIKKQIAEADLIVLSDYGKGCLTRSIIGSIVEAAKKQKKPVLVDPKGVDFTKYNGTTLLTPNQNEAIKASGVDDADPRAVELAAKKLLSEVEIESLIITLGKDGMKLFRQTGEDAHFSSVARQVFDVTGAGDTVIATLAVALGAGADLKTAIALANVAAGISVEKVGAAIISTEEIDSALQNNYFHK